MCEQVHVIPAPLSALLGLHWKHEKQADISMSAHFLYCSATSYMFTVPPAKLWLFFCILASFPVTLG